MNEPREAVPDKDRLSTRPMPPAALGEEPAESPTDAVSPSHAPPRLAEGVELLGEYEGSGFKEPRYLARRGDGDIIQLTELLYLIAEQIDGSRDHDAIAQRVSERYGRKVTADNVATLVDNNLAADGFIVGREPQRGGPKVDPLLAL